MEQKKGVVMQKIAAFFDWDGTLSYDGRTVSPATAEAVRTLRGRGNPVFLCTGRSTGFIPEEAWAVGFDGLVAAAGATVRLGDKLLLRRFIPAAAVERAVAFFLEDGQICILEGEHGMYRVGGGEVARFASWPAIAAPGEFSRRFPDEAVSKLTLHGRMSPAAEGFLSADYCLIRHATYTEAVPPGCSKSAGIRLILGELGLPPSACWAFGDSPNDMDMLQYAGIGVAMGNAPDEVKAAADLVSETAENDGVAAAIRLLLDGEKNEAPMARKAGYT